MKKITKYILWGFVVSSLLSYLFAANIYLPLIIIFFLIVGWLFGIPMVLDYMWDAPTHQLILIMIALSLVMMLYGLIKQKTSLGKTIFVLGFVIWSGVGVFYGLSTGT